ncbi:hypothetical protein AK51_02845 [Serratia nematodiphila DZ0503SBS1]|nr:hypothetical protein AK51_02845 [Serratia nematodiphila DZ0503SBS1]
MCDRAGYRRRQIYRQGAIPGGSGWRTLLGSKERDEENEGAPLPVVAKDDELLCERGEVVERQTQPPRPFTDASLLSAMTGIARFVQDKALKKILRATDGLGTEATRAGIIELLFKRAFLYKKGRYIHSSETGRALIHSLPDLAARPDMTANWEATLTQISEKSCRYQDFMQPLVGTLQELIYQAKQSRASMAFRGLPPPPSSGGKNAGKAPARRRRRVNEAWTHWCIGCRGPDVFRPGRRQSRRCGRGATGFAGDLGRGQKRRQSAAGAACSRCCVYQNQNYSEGAVLKVEGEVLQCVREPNTIGTNPLIWVRLKK